ncbi:S9 family peptidase [Paucihalobacter ruber]|uniref:S9 family peptidase n=1 Tax=Paucihalobacter ruber TaxID=2567861 RepID=A0A506PIK9_9FLAO|nr:prolyl oligopeptidase family serine peptidase [Paucihalobacter ruber]TPV33414.1 S9 family peptidase [Paucihalobacter ruber]
MKHFKFLFVLLLLPLFTLAQLDLSYQTPHDNIKSLADVTMPPSISINNDGSKALLISRDQYKTIAELSETELRLGGLRINPVTNISSRVRYSTQLELFDPKTKTSSQIANMPANPRIANISWSPKQNYIAFTNTTETGVELWVIDYAAKSAKKLTDDNLNANMGGAMEWIPNESGFLVTTLPANRPKLIDTSVSIPKGPTISVNEEGQKAQNRTYQDLLQNKADEANFETLVTSEIYKVNLDGTTTLWKSAGMYSGMSFSPDGNYVMVTEINKPFSYIVPYSRFPTNYNLYDQNGNFIKTITEVPLIEELPKGFMATRTGIRNVSWRSDQPATLYWVEALDGGDPETEVDFRDEVYQLKAPFTGEKTPMVKTKLRYAGVTWGNDQLAVVYERWWNTRTSRTLFFNPSNVNEEPQLFVERNYQDTYSDPGYFVTTRNQFDRSVLEFAKANTLILMGDGYSPDGKFPFIDEYNVNTQSKKRLYQSKDDDYLEDLVNIIDIKKGQVLVRLENATQFPNYYMRNIKTKKLEQITNFSNPFKALQDVHKEIITYKRDDGLELSGTLYLPVGYDKSKKEKMPMIMWAYPVEYKDRSSAAQVTSNSKEFTYPYYGSPIYWVNRGYVVLDDAAFPIIGEGDEEPNDSFVKQLVGNAKAAIDAVDAMGYIDRNRVAAGGHSYGAFMTANLLSHSDLFAAGIARSGAYNRTLTPFGFQSEERNYWEAPDVYNTMSPFMNAHNMKTPLLLIHGEADNNSGTYPMQSERYFNALKGLGAPVRLVMLPKESHGYAAKESIMHMLWEQDQWLETYVKNKPVE